MLSSFARHIATAFALVIGALGVVAILYAWGLPPFDSAVRSTEDAYVRGQVTALSPQISGEVAEVLVQDYQRVKKGELLVKLDDGTLREKLAQAKAQLEVRRAALDNAEQDRASAEAAIRSADATVVSAQASLKLAEADLTRSEQLRKRGVSAARDLDRQQAARDQAQAALDKARAEAEARRQALAAVIVNRHSLEAAVDAAKADVKLARINLDHTRITAPEDGRLGEVSARPGQYVSAGSRLATLVSDRIWVVANFKETELAGMRPGLPASFTVDALGDATLTGEIERFSPATGSQFSVLGASNATGNFIKISQRLPVRIAISPDQPLADRLAPGMSVVVSIDTGGQGVGGQGVGAAAAAEKGADLGLAPVQRTHVSP